MFAETLDFSQFRPIRMLFACRSGGQWGRSEMVTIALLTLVGFAVTAGLVDLTIPEDEVSMEDDQFDPPMTDDDSDMDGGADQDDSDDEPDIGDDGSDDSDDGSDDDSDDDGNDDDTGDDGDDSDDPDGGADDDSDSDSGDDSAANTPTDDDDLLTAATDQTLRAQAGNDTITMEDGATGATLHGDLGNDTITAGTGSSAFGGEGDDTLSMVAGATGVLLEGNDGLDMLTIGGDGTANGGNDADTLIGQDTATINGDAGNDLLTIQGMATGNGGAGDDTLAVTNADGGAAGQANGDQGDDTITVATGGQADGGAGNDTLIAEIDALQVDASVITTLTGGEGVDSFTIDLNLAEGASLSPDTPVVTLTDFDPTTEQLIIEIGDGDYLSGIDITPAGDGSYTDVTLTYDHPQSDGPAIPEQSATIRLEGVSSLSEDQITLLLSEDGNTASALTPLSGTDGIDASIASSGNYYMLGDSVDALVINDIDGAVHLGAGDDNAAAAGGSQTILAGSGNDTIGLNSGANEGQSIIYGGEGNDDITINRDLVEVYGGDGDNTFLAGDTSGANVSYVGGDGADDITLTLGQTADGGAAGSDSYTLNVHADHLGRDPATISADAPEPIILNLPPEVTGALVFATTTAPDGTDQITVSDQGGNTYLVVETDLSQSGAYATDGSDFTINRDVVYS